jgi:hypothetical protein
LERDTTILTIGIVVLLIVTCCAALAVVLAAVFIFGINIPIAP